MPELEDFLEAIAKATTNIFNQSGEMRARAVIEHEAEPDEQGRTRALAFMPLDHLDKDDWRAAVRVAWMGLPNPRQLCFVTEMWMKSFAIERDDWKKVVEEVQDRGGISEDPDRQEGIIYVVESPRESRAAFQKISRDADGKGTLGELTPMPHMEGRFTSFLEGLADD